MVDFDFLLEIRWFERDFSRSHSPVISFNLGSPYLQASGGDSPKLSGFVAPSHLAPNFGGTFSPLSSAHAFNLAAFRSPGFLGAHGFAAFGANIGYRDHSPNSFDGNTGNSSNNGNATINPLNAFNTNSNSPTNQYSSARSSISPTTRDGYLNSDYYHNNNTTPTTTATSKLTDSHINSEYLASDRHHSHSQHTANSNHHHHHHHHHHNNNNIHSIANSNHHSFERAASESPELSVNDQRCSPVESLRSYPTSQKSDEGGHGGGGGGSGAGYHSPSHPDSVGSRSPENLTAATKKTVGEMLDHHKIPLSFLGQPLAALHSMTEMKAASNNGGSGGGGGGGGNGNSANSNITGNGIGLQQTQSQIGSHGAANPHGIDTILSRPPPVTSAGLNALTSGKCILFVVGPECVAVQIDQMITVLRLALGSPIQCIVCLRDLR